MASTDGKARKRAIDFTDVKDRSVFNPKNVPEGDYLAVITSVTENESNSGNDQWVYSIELVNYDKGGTYPYYCQVDDNLWKIRNLIMATGIEVPKRKIAVDPNKLVDKEIGITMEDDEYEGRMKSVIANVFPADEVEEEPEEEEPVKQAPKRAATATKSRATAAKKTTTRGRRNSKPAVEDSEDVDEEEMEALELDDL